MKAPFPPVLFLVSAVQGYTGTFSNDQKALLVQKHNDFRREYTTVTPSNMLELKWDENLARSALKHAKKCTLSHLDKTGQNIYQSSSGINNPVKNINNAIKLWGPDEMVHGVTEQLEKEAELGYSSYGTAHTRMVEPQIAHATQMLWAKSHTLGCAASDCGYIVCEYLPAGNYRDRPLFTAKKDPETDGYIACADCPNTHPHCKNGLCSMDSPVSYSNPSSGYSANVENPLPAATQSAYVPVATQSAVVPTSTPSAPAPTPSTTSSTTTAVAGPDITSSSADCNGEYPTNYGDGNGNDNGQPATPEDCTGDYPTNYDNGNAKQNDQPSTNDGNGNQNDQPTTSTSEDYSGDYSTDIDNGNGNEAQPAGDYTSDYNSDK